jgi:hypothetical protein
VHEQPRPARGRPLATDEQAESTDPSLPAFLACTGLSRIPGHRGAEAGGFRLGMITDFLSEPAIDHACMWTGVLMGSQCPSAGFWWRSPIL